MTVTDKKVMCNGGTSAQLSAKVAAGGKIKALWSQWTHEQGPVMVWMYKCGSDFKSCEGSGKKWFKVHFPPLYISITTTINHTNTPQIDQEGMTSPPLSGRNWGTAKVLKNLYWESVVPPSLAPGNYLVRHELLALHQAKTPQFYAECAQIEVTGSGNAQPGAEFLANIPGYAPQSDPGIMVDTYASTATTYRCPGPEVWKE
jgi:hypothetical protein